jgi:hypothetical protein
VTTPAELSFRDTDGSSLTTIGYGLDLVLPDLSHPPGRDALVACCTRFIAEHRDAWRWMAAPGSRRWRAIRPGVEPAAIVSSWIEKLEPGRTWEMQLHGGRNMHDASATQLMSFTPPDWFAAAGHARGYLSASVSPEWVAEGGRSLLDVALEWARELRPLHGTVGFSLRTIGEERVRLAAAVTAASVARFPGLDPLAQSMGDVASAFGTALPSIGWLTIVGDALLETMGGRSALRAVDPLLTIHQYETGVIVQAGPHPQLGDVNRELRPDAYRAAAALLRPLRRPFPHALHAQASEDGEGLDLARTLAWQQRFD